MEPLVIVCFFTGLIHMTESLAYSMRLAGVRTRQIAIAMSFVTSTLLISRLSNMFQAPFLGAMVDLAILDGSQWQITLLEFNFRMVIFSAFCGAFLGLFFTPTMVQIFQRAILRFQQVGSVPKVVFYALHPKRFFKLFRFFQFPSPAYFKGVSLKGIPKQFLIFNIFVTAIYCIGVLCSLLAGAYMPEFRSTAIQLSGIVNGMATVMFTIFVDPPGARVTDQAVNGVRPEIHVKSVVFFLQMGKLLGTLFIAQILLRPLSKYILFVTQWMAANVS